MKAILRHLFLKTLMAMKKNVEKEYPNISQWIHDGTIEIGFEYRNGIVARAIDEGGVVWEKEHCKSFDVALTELEKGIGKWCKEMGI